MSRRALLLFVSLAGLAGALRGDPLSKKIELDFFRDVPSRNLKALATRSDGRLVAGPTLHDLGGTAPADLLGCLEPPPAPNTWLLGTGPDGRILEITLDLTARTQASREVVKLDDPQVFTVKRLADGALLAGTSPKGGLVIVRDGVRVSDAVRLGDGVRVADLVPVREAVWVRVGDCVREALCVDVRVLDCERDCVIDGERVSV